MQITAEILYKIRKVYCLSQAEIGALCDVSDAYINMIERGKRPVSEKIRSCIVGKFDLTPDKLRRLIEIYDAMNKPSIPRQVKLASRIGRVCV